MSTHTPLWIVWEGLISDDREDAPIVRIHFTAGSWAQFVPQTWEQPAEGGFFEDLIFVRAELDEDHADSGMPPLNEADQKAAEEWFNSSAGWDVAHQEAIDRADDRHTDEMERMFDDRYEDA